MVCVIATIMSCRVIWVLRMCNRYNLPYHNVTILIQKHHRQIKCLGHEFVGTVAAVPPSEKKWKVGDKVGGAWHGGHDFTCVPCGRGKFQMCHNKTVNGFFRDGGYGEYATLRTEAAVRIPKDADPAKVAPLLCAGQ